MLCLAGARVLVALQDLDVPWYVQQQVDAFPDSDWRKRDLGNPNWFDPLDKPIISLENVQVAASIEPSLVEIKNLTLSSMDFAHYGKMEPEGAQVPVAFWIFASDCPTRPAQKMTSSLRNT